MATVRKMYGYLCNSRYTMQMHLWLKKKKRVPPFVLLFYFRRVLISEISETRCSYLESESRQGPKESWPLSANLSDDPSRLFGNTRLRDVLDRVPRLDRILIVVPGQKFVQRIHFPRYFFIPSSSFLAMSRETINVASSLKVLPRS